ncbi:MAG: DNA polymerase III subunit, partial [Pyrinomonadaceae bacterium]|nr:DNA polymerase III subunit [Pyrinomonadaceae bacterium]
MFERLAGNQLVKDALRRMLAAERVPNALIFAGEEGLGKKLFALELAKALNCRVKSAGIEACDHCSSCLRIAQLKLPASNDAETPKQIIWSEHTDVGLLRPAGRFILVPQIRELERETNFRPYEGQRRVFLIEEADRLNEASSNALLKTLEEAPATSHLILITRTPASLLPTIRSRCQTMRFAPLAATEIEAYLIEHRKRSQREARLVAHLASGSLGRALELNLDDYIKQRDWVLGIVEALIGSVDRSRLLRAAEELSDAKYKEEYEPRLDVLETLIHDLW